jgi:hypothetical protein
MGLTEDSQNSLHPSLSKHMMISTEKSALTSSFRPSYHMIYTYATDKQPNNELPLFNNTHL